MKFSRYPEYKDSGVEWLGEVPAPWEIKPIKAVASCNDDVLAESTDPTDEIVYVEISGVSPDKGITEAQTLAFGAAPSRARRRVRDGDVLVSTVRTYLRAIAPLSDPPENMIASTGFAVIRPRAVNSAFLGYLFRSEFLVAAIIARSVGVSYPAINASDLMRLSIPVPRVDEQSAIATFVDRETAKIDALIAEQEKLIALLKEKRQALISHAVTKGLNPDAPMKPSGIDWLGDVPAHWTLRPLKYLARFQSGGTPSKENLAFWGGQIPWASAKDIKTEVLFDTEDHITDDAIASGTASLVVTGAVIVVVRGMILARTFPVTLLGAPMAINQDLKALIPTKPLASGFLAWYLRGTASESLNRLDEAGHGTKALRMESWSSLPIALPPLDEQQQIIDSIETQAHNLDVLAEESAHAIALLNERRSALISAAVTGKIDVRGAAAA